MRKKHDKKPEYIPSSRPVQQSWFICIGLYFVFLLWIEPVIDWLLTLNLMNPDQVQLDVLDQKKAYVAGIAFSIARSFPLLLFLWFGWQIYFSQSLPPKKIKMPFAVCRIESPKVRMYGMLIILVSLVLLFREIQILVTSQHVT